jgi:hypothetical protein
MTRRINPRKSKSGQPVPITRDKLLHGIDYIVVSGGGSASTPFSIEKKARKYCETRKGARGNVSHFLPALVASPGHRGRRF